MKKKWTRAIESARRKEAAVYGNFLVPRKALYEAAADSLAVRVLARIPLPSVSIEENKIQEAVDEELEWRKTWGVE